MASLSDSGTKERLGGRRVLCTPEQRIVELDRTNALAFQHIDDDVPPHRVYKPQIRLELPLRSGLVDVAGVDESE